MKIGYIRVSRDKQTTALQEDALHQERCDLVFTDKMSGQRFDRPEFLRMLEKARRRCDRRLAAGPLRPISQTTHRNGNAVGGTGNRAQKSQ